MFKGQDRFYFATVRKLSVAFGSLFNNIYIQRFDEPGGKGDVIRNIHVPLSYAAGAKWYTHRKQDIPAQESVQTKVSYPRIAFELTGIQYDPQRKTNTMNGSTAVNTQDVTTFLKQLNPAPVDYQFQVQIAIKNIDDGLQIIEQILPYFQPSFNLNVKDIPELQIAKDVPVILAGIQPIDEYEGAYEQERILLWSLDFVVKGYMYPPISDAAIIRKVIANVYKDKDLTRKSGVITVRVDPNDAGFNDDWEAKTNKFTEFELDSNQEPITDSNGDPL